MLRLAQALCLLNLAIGTAWGAPLMLTGMSRIGGETRAFFSDGTPSGYFSLTSGEDRDGVRLLVVEFRERWALVADHNGTNRITFGNPGVSPARQAGTGQDDGMLSRVQRQRLLTQPPLPQTSPLAAVADGNAAGSERSASPLPLEASGGSGGDGNAGSVVSASDESLAKSPPPRRPATADELFKARNGYAAWEDLLRQRHQAEMLAASPAANENP